MVIMGVDLGIARTGIAVSDEGEKFAFPKDVIKEYNTEKLIGRICGKAKEYGVSLIVVGLPKNMDGTLGERAKTCSEIALKIGEKSGIETLLYDERCTTMQAYNLLDMNDTFGKKRKETVDAVAATVILEDYLSYRKNKKLFDAQKQTLDTFLSLGAITKEQYDKSLSGLKEKMKI
ncbi:MAG: Holliday junction resolvase RuvX [Clostridia bacterium]|nr:Holliday junction resolvase RuvX [Clostridia bacterium]